MSSRKIVLFAVLVLLCNFAFSSCVATPGTTATVTSGQNAPSMDVVQAEAYNGPKARVAVSRFTDKTGKGWYTSSIGNGMADQLTTALFNSNRFIVLERDTLGDVMSEQDLGASGRIRRDTAAAIGQIEGAELLIVGAVTEFMGNASGGGGGLGGVAPGIFGAIAGGFRKAHMAIDIRVIDARTSRILLATSVEGEASDVSLGGLLGGFGGGGALAGALGGWKNTPTEKALRICIQKAVDFISTKTPTNYFHYGGEVTAAPVTPTVVPKAKTVTSASGNSGKTITRDVVEEMQNHLLKLGYNVGKPDGIAGKKTQLALLGFQKLTGLQQTGMLTSETIDKLRAVAGQ